MGFGMHNTSRPPRGNPLNYNLKGDASVHTFVEAAGLNIQNFPQYLSGLVAQGNDLASLSNEDWQQILAPMELGRDRAARVHKAISDLRQRAAKEDAEQHERTGWVHLVNGGEHPQSRAGAEVYEPKLNGERPAASNYSDAPNFIPVPDFQGRKEGWVFKHGDKGLGYYKEEATTMHTSAVPRAVGANAAPRSANPISQADLDDKVAATQQRQYTQSRQQQLLFERRQRLEQQQQQQQQYQHVAPGHGFSQGQVANMYANARTRSSPFATGY